MVECHCPTVLLNYSPFFSFSFFALGSSPKQIFLSSNDAFSLLADWIDIHGINADDFVLRNPAT